MRKVLVSIAALGAALAAVPSVAQSYGYPGGGYGQPGYGNGYNNGRYMVPSPYRVRDMVERAIQNREVSWREARELREDVRDLFRLEQRTRYGNDWDSRQRLQRKTFEVLRELREARSDRDRDDRWGRDRDDDYRYYNR